MAAAERVRGRHGGGEGSEGTGTGPAGPWGSGEDFYPQGGGTPGGRQDLTHMLTGTLWLL